jgi:hypothetical protein
MQVLASGIPRKPSFFHELNFILNNVPNYAASVFVPKSWGSEYYYYEEGLPSYDNFKASGYSLQHNTFEFNRDVELCDNVNPIDGLASIIPKAYMAKHIATNLRNSILSSMQGYSADPRRLENEIREAINELNSRIEKLDTELVYSIRYAGGALFIPVEALEIKIEPNDVLKKMTNGQATNSNLLEEFPKLSNFVKTYGGGLRLDDMSRVFRKEAKSSSTRVRFLTTDIPLSYMKLIGSVAVTLVYLYFFLGLRNLREVYQISSVNTFHPWLLLSKNKNLVYGPALALIFIPSISLIINLDLTTEGLEKIVILLCNGICLVLSGCVAMEFNQIHNSVINKPIPISKKIPFRKRNQFRNK